MVNTGALVTGEFYPENRKRRSVVEYRIRDDYRPVFSDCLGRLQRKNSVERVEDPLYEATF